MFGFLSFAIDSGMLPYIIFRHLWNVLILGLGIFMLLRIKGKENQGLLEHLEIQINDLFSRIEKKRTDTIWNKLDEMERRLRRLEGK
ncbi:MAG: hypothetical protein V1913_13170 [Fibrobacterota bacterium]